MNNVKIENQAILFARNGEVVRITACHENAIRFEAFPDCVPFREDYTLTPQSPDGVIDRRDHCVEMTVGTLTVRLEENGRETGAGLLQRIPPLRAEGRLLGGARHLQQP